MDFVYMYIHMRMASIRPRPTFFLYHCDGRTVGMVGGGPDNSSECQLDSVQLDR